MAGWELKIDDEFVGEMGKRLKTRGTDLQAGIDSYLKTLESIHSEAITKGDTADALAKFIEYGKSLNTIVGELGENIETVCKNYIEKVDEADQYLFEK